MIGQVMNILVLLGVLLSAVKCGAGDAEPYLIAKWSFENNTTDSSGNNNDGSVIGKEEYVDGITGKAFSFNGTTCIQVPYSQKLAEMDSITIAGFIKFRKVSNSVFIVDKGYPLYWVRLGACRSGGNLPCFNFYMGYDNLGISNKNKDWENDALCYMASCNCETIVQVDRWYHFAAVGDEKAMCLYIDGKLACAPVPRDGLLPKTKKKVPLFIGGRDAGTAFSGAIDELMIFNRALSREEISRLLQKTNLAGHMPKKAVQENCETAVLSKEDRTGNQSGCAVFFR